MGMQRVRGLARLVAVCAVLAAPSACAAERGDPAGTFVPSQPGVLIVATNLPAPGFWEGTAATPTGGFEYLLAQALADRFDLDEVRVVDIAFDEIVDGRLGDADLALAQVTPTAARDEVLDFTTSYLDSHPAVLVRSGTEVRDLAAARELRWVVQRGTTQVAVLAEAVRPEDAWIERADIASVVDAVSNGTADAALLDLPTALVEERLAGGRLDVVAQFVNDDGLAIAVPQGSRNLEALDSAVRAFLADGTIREFAEATLGRDTVGTQVDIPVIRSRSVAP